MRKAKNVKVELFGAAGTRNIEVKQRGGFPTRHIRTGTPRETEPLAITPDPEPTAKAPEFTPDALIDIIEKMTALDIQDCAQTDGWHCEDAIFKVTRINLRIDVSAPTLRAMLFDLVEKGTLEQKRAYGLNKFRLSVAPSNALTEVVGDAVSVVAIVAVSWMAYIVMGVC